MPVNEYDPEQALKLLMDKIATVSPDLARTVQSAVDAGKDVQAAAPSGRKNQTREYRRTVPYTYVEAIEVSLTALEAYFVAQPMFRNSCSENFINAASGMPRRSNVKVEKGRKFGFDSNSIGQPKTIQIELRTETQLLLQTQTLQTVGEVYTLEAVSISEIDTQQKNMAHLRQMLKFENA